ncbi:MAG: phosphoribosylglycinamide formyltransferase [Planctomycetes bacterium]|nr:phosphoribosylglycinamide formyltransferase [Planctomycetota bacterium]
MKGPKLKLAALISGGGKTVLNLQECIRKGTLDAEISVVISSRGDAKGVERARTAGLNTIVVERRKLDDEAFQKEISIAVGAPDLVCMAGFLSLWHIPEPLTGKVINIHPALLPDFGGKGMYGRRVHEAVLKVGRVVSGCTVHFCDNEYDHGPIILQRQVAVIPGETVDSLAVKVFDEECVAYPEAIQMIHDGRVRCEAGEAVFR